MTVFPNRKYRAICEEKLKRTHALAHKLSQFHSVFLEYRHKSFKISRILNASSEFRVSTPRNLKQSKKNIFFNARNCTVPSCLYADGFALRYHVSPEVFEVFFYLSFWIRRFGAAFIGVGLFMMS